MSNLQQLLSDATEAQTKLWQVVQGVVLSDLNAAVSWAIKDVRGAKVVRSALDVPRYRGPSNAPPVEVVRRRILTPIYCLDVLDLNGKEGEMLKGALESLAQEVYADIKKNPVKDENTTIYIFPMVSFKQEGFTISFCIAAQIYEAPKVGDK